MKIGEVYGTLGNKLLKSLSSSGKSMYIEFWKEFSYLSDITELKASIKYKKINLDCQTWLDIDKNILMSPNHSINSNCSWLITSNFGTFIRLNFTFIEVNYYFWLRNFGFMCSESSSYALLFKRINFSWANSLYSIFNLHKQHSTQDIKFWIHIWRGSSVILI